jgi:hypothetical protein
MSNKFIIIGMVLLFSCSQNSNTQKEKDKSIVKPDSSSHEEKRKISDNPDSRFSAFWNGFVAAVRNKDFEKIKRTSIDTIEANDGVLPVDLFVQTNFSEVFDHPFVLKLTDRSALTFINSQVDKSLMTQSYVNRMKNNIIINVNVAADKQPNGPRIIVLSFIEVSDGYRFIGYDSFG